MVQQEDGAGDRFEYGSGLSVLGAPEAPAAATEAEESAEDQDKTPPALDQLVDLKGQVKDCMTRLDKMEKKLKGAPLPAPDTAAQMQAKIYQSRAVQEQVEKIADVDARIAMAKHELEQRQYKQQEEKARFREYQDSIDKREGHVERMQLLVDHLELED